MSVLTRMLSFSGRLSLGMVMPSQHLQGLSAASVPGKVLASPCGLCCMGLRRTERPEFTPSNGSLLWKQG